MLRRFSVFIFLLLLSRASFAQATSSSPETEVRAALAQFIHSFEDLDWEGFRTAFDDDATVFYPRAFPERARGRAEFEKTFTIVFEQIRGGKTAPPYMRIEPRGLAIQMLGDTASPGRPHRISESAHSRPA